MRAEELIQEGIRKMFGFMVEEGILTQEHIEKTPQRFTSALAEMFIGTLEDPKEALSTMFMAYGMDDEMITVKEISFFSTCAHHILPFFGTVHFAYIPDTHIVGLSKIPRLVEVFARRPQVQEKLTTDIVDAFQKIVMPKGCAAMIRAYHMCCMSRGIQQPTSYTETTALRGIFKEGSTKNEFLTGCNTYPWSWR